MTKIWLRFRSGPYTIINVCLSISSQLCCKIELVSFWAHLNARPNCVILITSPDLLYSKIPILTIPMVSLYYSETYPILVFLVQSRIHEGMCYNTLSQVSECDTLSILSDHAFISQIFTGKLLDRVNEKFLYNSIHFLGCK